MKNFIIKLAVAFFLGSVSVTYACDAVDFQLNYYGIVKPKGITAYVSATVTSGYANSWSVTLSSGNVTITTYYTNPGGPGDGHCQLTVYSDTAGDYNITIKANGTVQKICNLVVNEVGSVSVSSTSVVVEEPIEENPITFTAISNPSCSLVSTQWQVRYSEDGSSWGDYGSVGAGFIPTPPYGNPMDANFASPGFYQVRARNGSNDDWQESDVVKAVGVENIEYNDPDSGYTLIDPIEDLASALYVHKGTTVTFKAVLDPPGASWPSGKPVWGGTSGASGTGGTKEVTFNTLSSNYIPGDPDYKTVTVECGNTITIYVIVYEFEGDFTPDDNFSGRSTVYYGLEETVDLDFNTNPWSVPCNLIGGLTWSKGNPSQPGTLSSINSNYGTADYDAGASDGTAWLLLTIDSGPSKGQYYACQKHIVKPSGTRLTLMNPGNVRHVKGYASAGIALYYWLDPKNVSFSNLNFGEGSCLTTNVDGFFLSNEPWTFSDPLAPPTNSYPNGSQQAGHSMNFFGGILGGNITTGCRVNAPDSAYTGTANPFAAGTMTWSIPTQYIDDTSTRHTFGSNQIHVSTFDASGDAVISKGGHSGSAALDDPTSSD